MCVFNGLEDTRACLESLAGTTEPFRLVVIDNGSTDGTPGFFERFPYEYPLTFAKSPANDGVIASLNRAWRLADTEFLCFLHNDTEMLEPAWLTRLLAALAEPDAGLAGLYGAKRLRADGRMVAARSSTASRRGRRSGPRGRMWPSSTRSACVCRASSSTSSAASTRATASTTATTATSRSPSSSAGADASSCTRPSPPRRPDAHARLRARRRRGAAGPRAAQLGAGALRREISPAASVRRAQPAPADARLARDGPGVSRP